MRLSILILTVVVCTSFPAQNDLKEIAAADELFNTQRYSQAYYSYTELLKKHPSNAWINYRLGAVFLASRSQKSKASGYLEKAIELSGTFITQPRKGIDAPVVTYKLLGDAYCLNHKFEKALDAYSKFKELASDKESYLLEDTEQKTEICKLGIELKEAFTLPDALKNIPKKSSNNYTTAITHDKSSMIYTLKVPLSKLQQPEADSKYFEELPPGTVRDTIAIQRTPAPAKKEKNVPDTVISYATVGASSDGQIILTYKTEGEKAETYISRLKSNKWTTPVRLAKNINVKGWEPGEFISADGNTMYFVSNKKGGFGGKDIYRCIKLTNGEWSKAVNLGPGVNSPYDEVAPFIHADGVTLYFSSNRITPEKGFDIFMVQRTENESWSKAVVIGYPVDNINSESFYQVAADAGTGKNTSKLNRIQNDSAQESTIEDNYVISFNDKKLSTLTLLKGKATSPFLSSNAVRITVADNITGTVHGVYYTDEKNGEYSFILPSGTNNNILFEAEGSTFASANIVVGKGSEYYVKLPPVTLVPIAESATIALNNIFFEQGNAAIISTSKTELQNVLSFVKSHPEAEVKLNYYITGGDKSEQKSLAKKRAQVIAAHLIINGIDKERIKPKGVYKKPPKKKRKGNQAEEPAYREHELILEIGKIKKQKHNP